MKKIICISIFKINNERQGINNNMSIEEMFYGNDFKIEDMLLGKSEGIEQNFIKSTCHIDLNTGELKGFFTNIEKPINWYEGNHYIYRDNNLIPINIKGNKYSVCLELLN